MALSIDALAVGLSLGELGISVWHPVVMIGVVADAVLAAAWPNPSRSSVA